MEFLYKSVSMARNVTCNSNVLLQDQKQGLAVAMKLSQNVVSSLYCGVY